jgi:hypothetical protein
MKKQIESIEFVKSIDEYFDTSCIGEYTDTLSNYVIVRKFDNYYCKLTKAEKENMPLRSNEMRYFIPYASGEIAGTKRYFRYGKRDYKHMESINNGDICFLYCGMQAKINIGGIYQEVQGMFIGGIESNSKASYFNELKKEFKSELFEMLRTIGFSVYAINQAFKNIEEKERY